MTTATPGPDPVTAPVTGPVSAPPRSTGCGWRCSPASTRPRCTAAAGVHVTYLARELAGLVDLTVHCQGKDRPDAVAHRPWELLAGPNQALQTISADLSMTAGAEGSDLVHSHTWYANLGGHLASLLYGIPHVMTMHSLEPLRPWKAEQLGGGYALSSWCERVSATAAAAVIARSNGMRADILRRVPGRSIPAGSG